MQHYPKWLSWIHLCIISSFQHQVGELYLVRRNTFSRLHGCYFSRRVSVDHNNLWLGFSSLGENVFKLIVLRRLFATAVLTLNQWNIVPCIAQGMPLNIMSSLPLLLVTWHMVFERRCKETKLFNVRCWVCKLRCQLCFFSAKFKFYN